MEPIKTTSQYLSSAEKERAIGFLTNAFSNDIINIDEFESRVESVHISKTHVELQQIFDDLPTEDTDDRNKIAEHENITCDLDNRTIVGSMLFAKKLNIAATSSKLTLDYQSVDLPDGVYEVCINAVASNLTIELPRHYDLENRITNSLASVVKEPKIEIDNHRRSVIIKLIGNIEKSKITVVKVKKPFWSK
jgi:Domain of unknown function (DUF1707)